MEPRFRNTTQPAKLGNVTPKIIFRNIYNYNDQSKKKKNCPSPPQPNVSCITAVTLSTALTADDWIVGNARTMGYYRVNYDDASWTAIQKQLRTDHTVCIVLQYHLFGFILLAVFPSEDNISELDIKLFTSELASKRANFQ